MGKRGDGIDTSTFYRSGYARDRSKGKVWELNNRRCITSAAADRYRALTAAELELPTGLKARRETLLDSGMPDFAGDSS
jgi:hypothetical protein